MEKDGDIAEEGTRLQLYGDAIAATRTRRRRRRRHLESRVHGAFAFLSFSSSESPFSAPAKFKEPLLSSRERRKERVRPKPAGTRLSDERSAISIRSSEMRTSIGPPLRGPLTPFSLQLICSYSSGISKIEERTIIIRIFTLGDSLIFLNLYVSSLLSIYLNSDKKLRNKLHT